MSICLWCIDRSPNLIVVVCACLSGIFLYFLPKYSGIFLYFLPNSIAFLPNIHTFTSNSYIFYYYYCYSLYLYLFHIFSIYLYMLHPLFFLLFARPYSLLFCAQRCLKSLLIHLYRVPYFRPKENVIFLCFRAIK